MNGKDGLEDQSGSSLSAADASALNAPQVETAPIEDIVSVNKKGSSDNKAAKVIFILVVGAVLIGAMTWFSQIWLNGRKAQLKASSGPKAVEDTSQVFNPEKTSPSPTVKPKIGADSGQPAPSQVAAPAVQPGVARDDAIRPLRGADGKVMVNAQGRAMGVDKSGNVVEVPAITALETEPASRKPLPGEAAAGTTGQPQGQPQAQPGQGASQAPAKPPSRFGGALYVGEPIKPTNISTQVSSGATTAPSAQAQQVADILKAAGLGGTQPTRTSTPAGPAISPPPEQARPGTIGAALYTSATPVALAKRMTDQNLILPKGRQADCILTGRIIDEVAGFTSCVLAQNLYSDNGRVLLLERGSELSGEYGVTNQLGLERLFVTWNRLKTPDGIEIDLSSPGADRLGTSGVPGNLDNRWAARIGAAFLLSFVKDITVAIINKHTQTESSAAVNVQTMPGQNTLNASSALAEEVIKQTIKVRPRLTVNEGDRISIYVARDLDFSPVYALKTAGTAGTTRLLTR